MSIRFSHLAGLIGLLSSSSAFAQTWTIDPSSNVLTLGEGETFEETITDSGGVGDHIEWTVEAEDGAGNVSTETCSVYVVRSGRSKWPDRASPGR